MISRDELNIKMKVLLSNEDFGKYIPKEKRRTGYYYDDIVTLLT
jgi:hypothetical protein